MTTRPRRRHLRPEEIDLWRQVLRDVRPMPGARVEALPETAAPPPAPAPVPVAKETTPAPPVPTKKTALPQLAPLERRLRQKLSRRQLDVDAALDLHGLRQDEAHHRLRQFLHMAQRDGARLVLVVTGKGSARRGGGLFDEVGILRRNVPHWLSAPDMRGLVVSIEEATATHGGAGALYVRLRRFDRPQRD